ncbi:LytTR family DNA-binding domain-containing protein [Brevundimonas sp. Root1423]|uniref:LytTR family DNA-binding domain-containing protein n=1 Tax=Brevundimonas sp. Root1423 TaxID=1736462 RepID=UPI001F29C16B|nr:LytTR family DNA-binding domain-containing protein [Brevundimonas sp. Root1423]
MVRFASVLAVGLLLGFATPFEADPPLRAPVRYAFWVGLTCAGYLAALAGERLLSERLRSRVQLRLGAAAIVSAVPMTFVAAWVVPFVRPGHHFTLSQIPNLFSVVATIQLLIAFTLLRSSPTPARPSPAPAAPAVAYPRALLSRLPGRLGEQIIALEAEDHYLRVHTALGSDLVLMRLSDAIATIEPDLGLQVHRSWWIAHDAIREVNRSQHRAQLQLSNGLTVPVGRTYLAAVRSRTARLVLDG